jgi:hypothetical protein
LANLAIFYQDTIPGRARSVSFAKETLPYRPLLERLPEALPDIRNVEKLLGWRELTGGSDTLSWR